MLCSASSGLLTGVQVECCAPPKGHTRSVSHALSRAQSNSLPLSPLPPLGGEGVT